MACWIFTRTILAGEPIRVFNHGEMRRDFTYIDDIVAGVIAWLDDPPRTTARRRQAAAWRRTASTISATTAPKS